MNDKFRQLKLDLFTQHSYQVDDYIVVPSNQSMVDQLLSNEASSSTLNILFGPRMSGKTHLSHLWASTYRANFLFDGYLKVADQNIPELSMIIGASAIIIDDIDQKNICEKTIFHIINLAKQANKQLLFTATKPLMAWGLKLPDLISRLKAAKHVEIPPPDDMLIETMLTKVFAEKQLNIADNIVTYIAPRIDRSISAIIQLIDKLDDYALQEKKPITRKMVAKILENRV